MQIQRAMQNTVPIPYEPLQKRYVTEVDFSWYNSPDSLDAFLLPILFPGYPIISNGYPLIVNPIHTFSVCILNY